MPEVTSGACGIELSVLLPAYNEEAAIGAVIGEVRSAMKDWPGLWELLVVDDGSTDQTSAVARALDAQVIKRDVRGGSGTARKTGIRAAGGAIIAMMDADGSYDPAQLPDLLSHIPEYDQVNGARNQETGEWRILRRLVKAAITKFAVMLVWKNIPDLNSGMKVFKRNLMAEYLELVPDGFSCVSAMTLAFLCEGLRVKFVPISYRRRIGKSKFRPIRDTARYLWTVVRIVAYLRPGRIALLLAAIVGAVALGALALSLWT